MLAALEAWLTTIALVRWLDWGMLIVLLSLALYFTRNSRAVWLVRGFIGLLVLYLLTDTLPMLHLLLDKLLLGSAVALGVLFQPELRRMLEILGRGFWLNAAASSSNSYENGSEAQEDYLEELVQAVRELSQNRTGALIVIEFADTPIDPRVFTDKGVTLQAHLSRELLQTIFQTSTLLHDGAVIMRADRIKAAGVILPVSERVASRQLGTRHRAAMGISEQAKCLCVIVSEETGSISLAEAGRLERPLTSSKLRELLLQRLRPPKSPGQDAALHPLWPSFVTGITRRLSRTVSTPLGKTLPKE